MSDVEEVFSKLEYWDEYYAKSNGQAPIHEWLRSFADLEEFFQRSLFKAPGFTAPDNPVVLHLGSGDSVRYLLTRFAPTLANRIELY
jgi:hypothetical protein